MSRVSALVGVADDLTLAFESVRGGCLRLTSLLAMRGGCLGSASLLLLVAGPAGSFPTSRESALLAAAKGRFAVGDGLGGGDGAAEATIACLGEWLGTTVAVATEAETATAVLGEWLGATDIMADAAVPKDKSGGADVAAGGADVAASAAGLVEAIVSAGLFRGLRLLDEASLLTCLLTENSSNSSISESWRGPNLGVPKTLSFLLVSRS